MYLKLKTEICATPNCGEAQPVGFNYLECRTWIELNIERKYVCVKKKKITAGTLSRPVILSVLGINHCKAIKYGCDEISCQKVS